MATPANHKLYYVNLFIYLFFWNIAFSSWETVNLATSATCRLMENFQDPRETKKHPQNAPAGGQSAAVWTAGAGGGDLHCRAAAGTCESLQQLTLSLALTQSLCWNTRWFCHKHNWVTAHICLATCRRCDDQREQKSHCDVSWKPEMPRGMGCLLGQFSLYFFFYFFFCLDCVLSSSGRRSGKSTGWLQWCETSDLNSTNSTWKAVCRKCQ